MTAPKKPRTPKQLEALELGRAKRRERQAEAKARKAGVDTTKGAGEPTGDLPPGAPDIRTTPYQSAPESPEQKARREKGEPEPTPEPAPATPEPTPEPTGKALTTPRDAKRDRDGLLGFLKDGLFG